MVLCCKCPLTGHLLPKEPSKQRHIAEKLNSGTIYYNTPNDLTGDVSVVLGSVGVSYLLLH